MSPTRLEAFSDGVIAIIITIMVLELKVPHENGLAGLLSVLPVLVIYALSFLFTGTYWVNHHGMIHRCKSVTLPILWANLGFLFALSLLPFFTDYLGEKEKSSFAAALYCGYLLLPAITFFILRWTIHSSLRRVDEPLTIADIAQRRAHLASISLYALAVPAAYWHPWAAIAVSFLVTFLWIVPAFGEIFSQLFRSHPKAQSR